MSAMIMFTGVNGEQVYVAPDKVTAVKDREHETSYVYLVGDGVMIVQGSPKDVVEQLEGGDCTPEYWFKKANIAMGRGSAEAAAMLADKALKYGASLGDLTSALTDDALQAWRGYGGTV